MGYCTSLNGKFELDKNLSANHLEYIRRFAETRRIKRDAAATSKLDDPLRIAVGLPVGEEGEFYVGEEENPEAIVDYNQHPSTQPALNCCWTCDKEGKYILWNGNNKPYGFDEWLKYYIDCFLEPWGYKISGKVSWVGEEEFDAGTITVTNNEISSDWLHNHKDEPKVKALMANAETLSDRSKSSESRAEAMEALKIGLDGDVEPWFQLVILKSAVDAIFEDPSMKVTDAAARLLQDFLNVGVEMPPFLTHMLINYDTQKRSADLEQFLTKIKEPLKKEYGLTDEQFHRRPYPTMIEPFPVYWTGDALRVDGFRKSIHLDKMQTDALRNYLVNLENHSSSSQLEIEDKGMVLSFEGNQYQLGEKDGVGLGSSIRKDDPEYTVLLKALEKALHLFENGSDKDESPILLNSGWAD